MAPSVTGACRILGMARQYRDINGNVRRAREYAGFRGTVRYVSPTIHARKEPGPADDLIGWLYSMVKYKEGMMFASIELGSGGTGGRFPSLDEHSRPERRREV